MEKPSEVASSGCATYEMNLCGKKCGWREMAGTLLIITGICMVVMAIVIASKVWGMGAMYLLAGGLTVGSIAPFCGAAILLLDRESSIQTTTPGFCCDDPSL